MALVPVTVRESGRGSEMEGLLRARGIAVAACLVAAVLATGCGSSAGAGSKTKSAAVAPSPKVAGTIKPSAFVTGDKQALAKLKTAGVWCRWVGDHVQMRIEFRNRLAAHITVHVQPNYRLANAGLHGDGLSSQQDVGIDAGKFRAWFGDLGSPDGISGHPAITTCAPEINGVDLG
jgi:hypothetical protein